VATLVLIHSPLLNPSSWAPVAKELARQDVVAVVPDLDGDESKPAPLWTQHANGAASSLRPIHMNDQPILVGHSGAGPLLPAIRQAAARPVGGYLFVDAGLPDPTSPRMGTFGEHFRQLYAAGGRYPDWTDKFLRDVVPNRERRLELMAGLRPQPFRFWEETIPVFSGWPDAPCAYMRFSGNSAYEEPAREAARLGWPVDELPGNHFHMLVDPVAVANGLIGLYAKMHPSGL
jgi:hypothetical protein